MNLNDKNIDQVFRDAAQNSDAPRYDHSYWKEVNSILNNEDKRKRGFILWSVAGSIIAALLVSSLFIVNDKEADLLVADNIDSSINQSKTYSKKEASGKEFTSNQDFNKQVVSNENDKVKRLKEQPSSININNNDNKVERFANTKKLNSTVSLLPNNEDELLESDVNLSLIHI